MTVPATGGPTVADGRGRPPVEVGVGYWSMQSGYVHPRSLGALYREAVDEIRYAESLGFDTVWVGEHHNAHDGYCPSPLLASSFWAAATERVRIGVGVLVLPLHGAPRVHAAVQAIESVAPGRLRVAFGLGYREPEFDARGLRVSDRKALMDDALDTVSALRRDGRFGADIWVGGHSDVALGRAARHGCSVLLSETVTAPAITSIRARLDETATAPARLGAVREVWIEEPGERSDGVRARLREMWWEYSRFWFPPGRIDEERRERLIRKYLGTAIVGPADQVLHELTSLVAAGVDTLALRVRFDGGPTAPVRRCLDQLASDVVPALRSP